MADYRELVQITRLLCGMQGTGPATIASAQGVEEVLVRFVRDAYVDIQNRREEWDFLLMDKSIALQPAKDTYTLLDVFFTTTPDFKKYKKDSFRITDSTGKKTYLKYAERDYLEARYLNETTQKLPVDFSIRPQDNALIFKPIPDQIYTVDFRYYSNPEVLLIDTQIPKLPLAFHNMITYAAAAKMGVYLGSPEVFQEYSRKTDWAMGQLMRLSLPKKRMNQRPMV